MLLRLNAPHFDFMNVKILPTGRIHYLTRRGIHLNDNHISTLNLKDSICLHPFPFHFFFFFSIWLFGPIYHQDLYRPSRSLLIWFTCWVGFLPLINFLKSTCCIPSTSAVRVGDVGLTIFSLELYLNISLKIFRCHTQA